MRFGFQPKYSSAERTRLIQQGDNTALHELEAMNQVPLLTSLVFLVRTLLITGFVTYAVSTQGVFSGIIISTLALVLMPLAFRLPFFVALADGAKQALMPLFQKGTRMLAPFLRGIRERDTSNETNSALNSKEELIELVKRAPEVVSREEYERLVASLQFDEKKVRDVMTPRSMIDAVPVGETLGPLVLDELYKTGHSRFPVYKGDLDHVVGMLYLHDLVDMRRGSQPAKEAMQSKVYFIREDKDLSHALHGFLMTRHHLFVVVNAYRETVGLLSLEDVMEVLLGAKIQDEFDAFDDLRAVAEHNPHKNNQPKSREDIS